MPLTTFSTRPLQLLRAPFPLFLLSLIATLCLPAAAQSGVNLGSVNVGSSASATGTLTMSAAGTVDTVEVVTQGSTGLDFTDAGTGTCKTGTPYTAKQTCTVGVKFAPSFPGIRYGAAKLLDSSGNVLATSYLHGTGIGPQISFLPGLQTTVATGIAYGPNQVAVDSSGNVYIADSGNDRLLKETLSAGSYTQSIIASGIPISGVAVDGAGNVYFSAPSPYFTDPPTGQIVKETLSAGSYTPSIIVRGVDATGEVAVDSGGNIYLAESLTGQVVKESLSEGSYTQSIVASGLNGPFGLAVDGSGNVFIAANNGVILKETLSAGSYVQSDLSSLESEDGGNVHDLAVDGTGNIYVTASNAVYKSTPSGEIFYGLFWGQGEAFGMAVDGSGALYVATSVPAVPANNWNYVVEKIDYTHPPSLSFAPTYVGLRTDFQVLTLGNTGNAPLNFPVPAMADDPNTSANFNWGSNCLPVTSGSQESLAAAAWCQLDIAFAPVTAGNLSLSLVLTDDSLNAAAPAYTTQSIPISGTALATSPAVLTSPKPGSTLTASSQTFTWTPGSGVSAYELWVGTTNPSSSNVYHSAWLRTTSVTVGGIPTSGGTIYVRLSSLIDSAWQFTDYTFIESGGPPVKAALTSPTVTTLTGSSQTFTWSAGAGVAKYGLRIGTTGPGSDDVYNLIPTLTLAASVSAIPTNGVTLYVRLFSNIDQVWQFADYTFKEAGGPPVAAVLTAPAGTTLSGSSQTFTWTPGVGVTYYELWVGTTNPSSSNIYRSGWLTATSVTVNNIPANAGTAYVRLCSRINGAWQFTDYTFTESGGPR